MKILLVDDSKLMRWENQHALQRTGYEVVCADDGEEALRIASKQTIDIIILDLLLPKMGGLDVLRNLKSNPLTAEIPVVVLSGLSGRNRDKLMEAGAEEYLEKSALIPRPGENLLPTVLEEVVCRIGRRKGVPFMPVQTSR